MISAKRKNVSGWTKQGTFLFYIGFFLLVAGYVLLGKGSMTVAPFLIISGYVIVVTGLVW